MFTRGSEKEQIPLDLDSYLEKNKIKINKIQKYTYLMLRQKEICYSYLCSCWYLHCRFRVSMSFSFYPWDIVMQILISFQCLAICIFETWIIVRHKRIIYWIYWCASRYQLESPIMKTSIIQDCCRFGFYLVSRFFKSTVFSSSVF